jgi:hypothetical protein
MPRWVSWLKARGIDAAHWMECTTCRSAQTPHDSQRSDRTSVRRSPAIVTCPQSLGGARQAPSGGTSRSLPNSGARRSQGHTQAAASHKGPVCPSHFAWTGPSVKEPSPELSSANPKRQIHTSPGAGVKPRARYASRGTTSTAAANTPLISAEVTRDFRECSLRLERRLPSHVFPEHKAPRASRWTCARQCSHARDLSCPGRVKECLSSLLRTPNTP